jgi:hypothetical protein
VASIAMVIGLIAAARYYLHTPLTVIKAVVPQGRPYLVISDSKLEEPLSPGKNPVLVFAFENTGPVEITGYFRDATCTFSDFVDERFLTYIRGESGQFKLAPREKHIMRWPFAALMLDEYQIKLVNENTATLYLFARGEYSDESGNKYPITYCRQYSSIAPGNLVICKGGITFREPKEGDQ